MSKPTISKDYKSLTIHESLEFYVYDWEEGDPAELKDAIVVDTPGPAMTFSFEDIPTMIHWLNYINVNRWKFRK